MTDPLPERPERVIGHYRILRELGRGGQGVVYLADDQRLRRRVALKVLTGRSTDSDTLERFQREAETASKIDHPGICAVYDIGTSDGVPYIAMRYVEGETIASKINTARNRTTPDASRCILLEETVVGPVGPEPGDLPAPDRVRLGRSEVAGIVALIEQAARALHVAHEHGVIHRDMKPQNVMIAKNGEPVILDFGFARDLESDQPTITQPGGLCGTYYYMSPEQLLASRVPLDRRTDVWSLGVMLYECLTLMRPFDSNSPPRLMQAIETKEPADPRTLNPVIHRDLKVILEKALEKDRDRRYATAEDFARDLRNFLDHRPIEARAAGVATKASRFVRRHRVPLAAALVALALGLSSAFLWPRNEPAPPSGRRFVNVATDLLVEAAPAVGPMPGPWERMKIEANGAVRLDPGRWFLRAVRKNHFPYVASEAVDVRTGEVPEIPISFVPIELWSRRLGQIRSLPLVVRHPDSATELMVRDEKGFRTFLGLSGVETGATLDCTSSSARPNWLTGSDSQPVIVSGGSDHLTAKDLARRADGDGNFIDMCAPARNGGDPFVSTVFVGDVDGDEVGDLFTAQGSGRISMYSSRTMTPSWRIDRPRSVWTGLGHASDSKGRPTLLFAITGSGDFLILSPAGKELESHVLGVRGVSSIVPLARGRWPTALGLAGGDGAFIVSPAWDWKPRPLVANGAATIAVFEAGGAGPAPMVAVAGSGQLSAFDHSAVRRWTIPLDTHGRVGLGTGDLDGRAGDEIIAAGSAGFVRAFSGSAGGHLWSFEAGGVVAFDPLVEDLDGDGFGEVVIAAAERVFVLRGCPESRHWVKEADWQLGSAPQLVRVGDQQVLVIGTCGHGVAPYETAMSGPTVHAFDPRSGSELWKYSSDHALLWSPDVADLDDDGLADTLVHERSGKLVGLRVADGSAFVIAKVDPFLVVAPRLADLDGDSKPDILYSDFDGGRRSLVAFDPRRNKDLWRKTSAEEPWLKSLYIVEVCDVGGDGTLEILCSAGHAGLRVCSGRDGVVRDRLELPPGRSEAPGAIADLDGDGAADLLVALISIGSERPPSLTAFDGRTLQKLWRVRLGGEVQARPAFARLAGEGPVVVISDWGGNVTAFDARGGQERWSTKITRFGTHSSPQIADLDGDGGLEVVVGTKDRGVCVLDAVKGTPLRFIGTEGEVWGTALLTDVGGSPDLEIIIGSDDRKLHCIRYVPPARPGR